MPLPPLIRDGVAAVDRAPHDRILPPRRLFGVSPAERGFRSSRSTIEADDEERRRTRHGSTPTTAKCSPPRRFAARHDRLDGRSSHGEPASGFFRREEQCIAELTSPSFRRRSIGADKDEESVVVIGPPDVPSERKACHSTLCPGPSTARHACPRRFEDDDRGSQSATSMRFRLRVVP